MELLNLPDEVLQKIAIYAGVWIIKSRDGYEDVTCKSICVHYRHILRFQKFKQRLLCFGIKV